MKNLPCVLWLLGYPLTVTLGRYVNEYLLKKTYSNGVEALAEVITLIIWVLVGIRLYQG